MFSKFFLIFLLTSTHTPILESKMLDHLVQTFIQISQTQTDLRVGTIFLPKRMTMPPINLF